ncbi:uncharacterized protein LOC117175670 [Belonocnema kinseyi]|uniref:uncharacterized protein LOC117175670 n=1 Tax=Belonocnema kinseyi TaxID=2817044 RepID=UPI00143CDAD2|nr:uncharacterized protein LOC117175670 [Belonocnema kinseyi]
MSLGNKILLVLCFIMIVSADPQKMLNTLHTTYVHKTARIMSSFLESVAADIKVGKQRKFLVNSCHDEFVNLTKEQIDPILATMTACYTNNTNSGSAEKCYKKTQAELTKKALDLHNIVKKCIQIKCAAKYFPRKCKP